VLETFRSRNPAAGSGALRRAPPAGRAPGKGRLGERLDAWRIRPYGHPSDEPSPPTTPFRDALPMPPAARPAPPFATAAAGGAPATCYRLVQEEASVSLHAELPRTWVWRYRDAAAGAVPSACSLGPTIRRFVDEPPAAGGPVVVRVHNELPDPHGGFGLNCTTTHLLGGHVAARFDGFPEDPADDPAHRGVIGPGEHADHGYALRDAGHLDSGGEPGERPSTLVYRDNVLDFAAPNVYRGLTGLFLVFDEFDADDETGARFPDTNLRLPSGEFDIPLVIQDRQFDAGGQLVFLAGDRNSVLGDKFLVNGKVQPYLAVKRRKYRFRLVNGSIARLYVLGLADGAGRSLGFDHLVASGGGLLARPISGVERLLLAAGERREVVIDFRRFAPGAELYLEDGLDQDDPRGPRGGFADPDLAEHDRRRRLMKFIVRGETPLDTSAVPARLRPLEPVAPGDLARAVRRRFEFARSHGAWTINGAIADVDVPMAVVGRNEPEAWTLGNASDRWAPIRIARAFMRVLRRNGAPPPPHEADGLAKTDCVLLAPGDQAEVFLKFRDYPGRALIAGGNLAHADMFLRARFDVA
jgi:FtsP/CotA-like multicopper oxidase with cupredoxin domain